MSHVHGMTCSEADDEMGDLADTLAVERSRVRKLLAERDAERAAREKAEAERDACRAEMDSRGRLLATATRERDELLHDLKARKGSVAAAEAALSSLRGIAAALLKAMEGVRIPYNGDAWRRLVVLRRALASPSEGLSPAP